MILSHFQEEGYIEIVNDIRKEGYVEIANNARKEGYAEIAKAAREREYAETNSKGCLGTHKEACMRNPRQPSSQISAICLKCLPEGFQRSDSGLS